MNSLVAEVEAKGYSIVRSVLLPSEVQALKERLHKVTLEQNTELSSTANMNDQWMTHNLMFKGDIFLELLNNSSFLNAVDSLLSDTSIIYAYQSSSMPSNGTNYSNRIHVDCPRFIKNYITNIGVIFPLDDFTAESGATFFLPESHKSDSVPDDELFYKEAERAICSAGDMIVFNARTFHSGGQNKTSNVRHAITINLCRSYMRQRFYYPKMCSSEFEENLNISQRRLLGFNVRMPESMEQFYLPEGKRLYLPNQG